MQRRLMLFLALFAPLLAGARESGEIRHPGAQERASFEAFYRARFNDVPLSEPSFKVTRPSGGGPWSVSATLDSPVQRGVAPLCRMSRSKFLYEPRAAAKLRWSVGTQQSFAWLSKGACVVPDRLFEVLQAVPDTALIALLEQHGVMLLKARLLFSGNSSCAPVRALRFRLMGIDVGAPPGGVEHLYALVFDSDRDTLARVWVKQRGQELNAWSVACAAVPAST
jgi:hypothetical protein